MQLNIDNEYASLEAVMVHRPGPEIERLTHENMRRFLFEDIPYLTRMRDEHDEFVGKMQERGIRVLYLDALLRETFAASPGVRGTLIEEVCEAHQVPALAADLLDERIFAADALVTLLFAGITRGEFREATGRALDPAADAADFLIPPIPNAYFTRDPAVVVSQSVISCRMHYVQRLRETILARTVIKHHPDLEGHHITYGASPYAGHDPEDTIEGGDVIILNEEAILIGASERTRSQTIEVLAQRALNLKQVSRVYEIPIPTERLFMHLDTVFTIVDRGTVVWFPGVMNRPRHILHYERGPNGGVVRKPESRDIAGILADEFGCSVNIIETGGGDAHFASREQRTDGTNLFAIAPRLAVSYERNERTLAAMEKAGIECIRVVGSELVRGLGGPRCMTMPLRRAPA